MLKKFIAAALLLASIPGLAYAHAALVKSTPGARAVLSQMPAHIELCFNEAVELKFSAIKIIGAQDTPLPTGDLAIGATPNA